MRLEIVNSSSVKISPKTIKKWIRFAVDGLKTKRVRNRKMLARKLTVVFLNPPAAKTLNKQFRRKNYATDVLSFAGLTSDDLGEIVICPQVIKKQAREHRLQFEEELGYMLIHGILHLLGYDHELGRKEAKRMFGLQDAVFEKILTKER